MCHKWERDIGFKYPGEPSVLQWKDFFASLKKLVGGKIQINFAGGEPLTRGYVFELMRYASDLGFDVLLASNGFLIDEETAGKIAEARVTFVNLSLDSLCEEKHDYIRGVKGAYQKVMQAIENLYKEARETKIGICSVIMKDNIDELVDIVNWIEKNEKISGMGFQAITQPFDTPIEEHWHINPEFKFLWPDDIDEVNRIMEELIILKKAGFKKLGNSIAQFKAYKAYFHNPDFFIKRDKCHLDTRAINITPSGDMHICFYMGPIGNIKNDDICEVWFSKHTAEARKKIEGCKRNCQAMVNCNFDENELYIE
jgi:MoaA/NifB/PqqE/SkfB family radical SAM enzyme